MRAEEAASEAINLISQEYASTLYRHELKQFYAELIQEIEKRKQNHDVGDWKKL